MKGGGEGEGELEFRVLVRGNSFIVVVAVNADSIAIAAAAVENQLPEQQGRRCFEDRVTSDGKTEEICNGRGL